ncbi:hypothetical protein HanPI659440_Chr00c10g0721981 [Helianthus annuus]|nr:hypothetical protein HanPI659440_Chr00c10g0721981 [Helianthus annuus]
MAVMEKLKMFVVNEPIVAASCLIGGVGLWLFCSIIMSPLSDIDLVCKIESVC